MPKAIKTPDATAAVYKEWFKLETMAADESQKTKREVIDEARKDGKTVHFVPLMDISHLKEFGVGTTIFRNIKAELYSEVTSQKMDQALVQFSQSKDHQRHKWQQETWWMS